MKQSPASRKINRQAREVISSIILFEISDPRLAGVTITACEGSFDRSMCNVFYTADPGTYEDVAAAFSKAGGRIRSLMARAVDWRVAPKLRFLLDEAVDEGSRIDAALRADAARNARPAGPSSDTLVGGTDAADDDEADEA